MAVAQGGPSYSIRELSRLTGFTSDRIRAWELRYGLLRPLREPSGYRAYGPDDLRLLLTIRHRLAAGSSIGELAETGREALLAAGSEPAPAPGDALAGPRRAALRALPRGDVRAFCAAAEDASGRADAGTFWAAFARPVLEEVGDLWALGSLPIWIEHYVTRQVRRHLEALWGPDETRRRPVAILFCPEGELHELPLLGVAAKLRESGYQPLVLGANLPVESAVDAAEASRAALAAVSVTHLTTPAAARLLAEKLAALSKRCAVVAGGRSAERYRKELESAGIRVQGLEELAPPAPAVRRRKARRA